MGNLSRDTVPPENNFIGSFQNGCAEGTFRYSAQALLQSSESMGIVKAQVHWATGDRKVSELLALRQEYKGEIQLGTSGELRLKGSCCV